MTEDEWNTCRDPRAMWTALSNWVSRSDLVLFGCACCRRIWEHATDDRLRRGIVVREQFERGHATLALLHEAEAEARQARREILAALIAGDHDEHSLQATPGWAAGAMANAAVGNFSAASDLAARARACAVSGDWLKNYEIERAAQCDVLRSLVANPNRGSMRMK